MQISKFIMNFWLLVTILLPTSMYGMVRSGSSNGLKTISGSFKNASFAYQDINQCKRNEFYDLDNFECIACDGEAQPTESKLACQCPLNGATGIAFYDINREQPLCATFNMKCDEQQQSTSTTSTLNNSDDERLPSCRTLGTICPFKYVNKTNLNELMRMSKMDQLKSSKSSVHITHFKLFNNNTADDVCSCDLVYNFRYQDFCISNELLKPYLHYNAFWQSIGGSGAANHFGELKFVAFFCLRLNNATACQQLANLCVMSHYSMDKNSPCNTFLLTQASDVVLRYAVGMDEQMRTLHPFLFFKKGKQMAQELLGPVQDSRGYTLDANNPYSQLRLFSLNFALDGTLLRRGHFQFSQINLCGNDNSPLSFQFGAAFQQIKCSLTLENLIDMASDIGHRHFLSLYLNFTKTSKPQKFFMQSIPALIENLTLENQRDQPADWLLVRRFQMISAQARSHNAVTKPIYDDASKLLRYRSIRFAEKIEFSYGVHGGNRISLPLLRLRYRDIEMHANSTLNQIYQFKMEIQFSIAETENSTTRREILKETFLPLLLLMVITISMLRAHNHRKRRRKTIITGTTSTPQIVPVELCDFRSAMEFLLQLCSNASHALLLCFLANVAYDATKFLTQKELHVTLPLIKDEQNANTLKFYLYAALCLKFIFYCVHLWQASRIDIFFIDWERPKSFDNNHFNLKSNLETSSVCSSVRTFTTENNVSAWRIFFTANEWLRLCVKRKTSSIAQCFGLLALFQLFNIDRLADGDLMLKIYFIIFIYIGIYITQYLLSVIIRTRLNGSPLQKFTDLCSWANISVFVLLEPSYGFYIHGRSPHGFAETDMSSMIMQLQRESQSMCGRRGLLSDSDQQTYIILPPANLRTFFQRLLIPFQRSCSISQAHYQKESTSVSAVAGADGNLERTFIAYSSVNRFFCAFIDHAIKDMDYIIKELTFMERLLNCEFENYLTENKGTFYIDKMNAFSRLFLYGNEFHTFIMELIMFLSTYVLFGSLIGSSVAVCCFSQLVKWIFSSWTRRNISKKTLIDKRFLI